MAQLGTSAAIIVAAACLLAARLLAFWTRPWRSPLRNVPGPVSQHFYFGIVPFKVVSANLLAQWITEQTEKFGPVWAGPSLGRVQALFLADPLAVQHVMLGASPHFVKVKFIMKILQTFFGTGLLGVDGEPHKRHRKVAFPAFTGRAVIEDMGPHILGIGDDLVARFERKCADAAGEEKSVHINAYAEYTKAAFDTIGVVGFNYRFNSLQDKETVLGQAFEVIFAQLVSKTRYSILRGILPFVELYGHYFVEEQKNLDRARAVVDRQSRKLVDAAKKSVEKGGVDVRSMEGGDLLSLLIKSNLSPDTKPSERMSDEEVVSMVPTFLAAGHETTSSALAWAAHALTVGDGLKKQENLREELLDADNDGWQEDIKKLDSLPYLDAVCKEVLRLYAPVRTTRRTCTRDDVIPLSKPIKLRDGTTTSQIPIAKGDDVGILIYDMNTSKDIWGEDAKDFRPERFLNVNHPLFDGRGLTKLAIDSKLGWSSMATFTIGPRNCIGMRMAVAELKALLAKTIASFRLLPEYDTSSVEYRNVVVARPQVSGRQGFYMPCRIAAVN